MAAAIYGTDQADIVEEALSDWFKRKLTPKIIEAPAAQSLGAEDEAENEKGAGANLLKGFTTTSYIAVTLKTRGSLGGGRQS
jgi:hypothetical protein